MKRQKIVLKHCPHFYKILDFEIYEDDVISSKLISLYKDYIFSIDVTDEMALKKAAVQVLLLLIGIAMLVFGIWRDEAQTVFSKAIRVCMECVGIG